MSDESPTFGPIAALATGELLAALAAKQPVPGGGAPGLSGAALPVALPLPPGKSAPIMSKAICASTG